MNFDLSIFLQPAAWISLITLTFLEIVLGVDNIIFLSIVTQQLPPDQQRNGRNLGLFLAMLLRIVLLFFLSFIMGLDRYILFDAMGHVITGKGAFLLMGGIFLIYKSTTEIHHKITGDDNEFHVDSHEKRSSFFSILIQIALLNMVFSLDSILTAVGITDHIPVMILAVVLSILVMMKFTEPVSALVNKYPTLQILALSFLIMIGVTLVMEGFGQHVQKNFIYISVAFSLMVEILNIRLRKKQMQLK